MSAFLYLHLRAKRLLSGAFLCPLATQLFRVCNQRPIDFYPIAIVDPIVKLSRAAVNTHFVLRQIDIITQRQKAAGHDRLLDRRALLQLNALQILLFRQRVGDFNTILADTVDLFGAGRERLHHIHGQLFEDATKGHLNQLIGEFKIEMKLNFARFRAQG
jgi:hypothetical protein